MKNLSMKKKIILSVISGIAFTAISFYVSLPAINPRTTEFWGYLAFVILSFGYPFLFGYKPKKQKEYKEDTKGRFSVKTGSSLNPFVLIPVIAVFAVILIGNIVSSTVFNARAYASVIDVEEAVFAEDMKETDEVTNIALMDSTSAEIIGNRTLGSLSHVVSQYEIAPVYSQINYQLTPKKVANLEYADFFKWFANKDNGIPGYVMVDPVNMDAKYMELEKPLKYVESGFFGDDLMRKLRFSYPTKIFDYVSFEIDDSGKPYYIVSCVEPKVFPFGAMDVCEVILFDPCTGDSTLYAVEDAPAWVDTVFSGTLAEQKYNWHGTLSGGFINSVIGNKDCKQTTDDFGYIVIGDDVWYFTGVTSVTSDQSNIGFIISNARTGEYKYYPVVGAEEYSAMGAAEGEVQEKGYKASFPSLINVSGEATYIMVLKDANNIVKLYALVNVEQYGIVATGDTQAEAMSAYRKLLRENGIVDGSGSSGDADSEGDGKVTVTVEQIKNYTVGGNTVVYLIDTDGNYYKGSVAECEALVFVEVGDTVTVVCEPSKDGNTMGESLFDIISIEKAAE